MFRQSPVVRAGTRVRPGGTKEVGLLMTQIICKRAYATETATLIKKHTVGEFGDPAGYEETLYQTPGGLYFLYFRGGPASAYAKEDIKCLAKGKVDAWVESH